MTDKSLIQTLQKGLY